MTPLHAVAKTLPKVGPVQPILEPSVERVVSNPLQQHKRLHQASRQGVGQSKRRRTQAPQRVLKTLLIDNYDSYTYNLFQLLAVVNGVAPTVVRNTDLSWRELSQRLSRGVYDNVVISPGPGTPLRASDVGICRALLEEGEGVPILGVCLGMQALAHAHGAHVVPAPYPIHGRLSEIRHTSNALFNGIPSGPGSGFEVVRYHSLAVREESLPPCLEATAWSCGHHHAVDLMGSKASQSDGEAGQEVESVAGVLMGIAHRTRPHWGVQFHPESVATRYGSDLLHNFAQCTQNFAGSRGVQHSTDPRLLNPDLGSQRGEGDACQEPVSNMDVRWRVLRGELEGLGGSEAMFWHLFGDQGAHDTFWLDSASQQGQRFSYMGGRGGPLWQRIVFKLAQPCDSQTTAKHHQPAAELPSEALPAAAGPPATADQARPPPEDTSHQAGQEPLQPGRISITDRNGKERSFPSHFLDFLESQLQERRAGDCDLPFDFTGGYVGYLGYELKAECGSPGPHTSPHPDAAMFFCDRLVVVDHATGDVYLVALHQRGDSGGIAEADQWLASTQAALHTLANSGGIPQEGGSRQPHKGVQERPATQQTQSDMRRDPEGVDWETCISAEGKLESRRSRKGYMADIGSCLEALRAGESYELCLTTALRKRVRVDPRDLYSELRASNPSAHAAWLSFGDDLPTVCCSSPERFLKGSRDGMVEARPIKGTARRYLSPELDQQSKETLLSSDKARAENLMIVDLLRNDLGRFCEVGSVHVPGLMEVETYATVHNLVSTVRGMRRQGSSIVDCLRASFPGGSMTGAPKLRSMDILDKLENGPRGVYSGSLGFVGLNNTFDLNIVIRTAVVGPQEVTIGAGGAIVMQSDPEDEYEEMRLKARALMKAVNKCAEGLGRLA